MYTMTEVPVTFSDYTELMSDIHLLSEEEVGFPVFFEGSDGRYQQLDVLPIEQHTRLGGYINKYKTKAELLVQFSM